MQGLWTLGAGGEAARHTTVALLVVTVAIQVVTALRVVAPWVPDSVRVVAGGMSEDAFLRRYEHRYPLWDLVNRAVPPDRLVAEVDALADRLARVPPDVMAPTKLMLNRAMETAGFMEAVEAGLDIQSMINMSETQREFDAVIRRDGLKAALAWRDRRYEERLAGAGRAGRGGRGSAPAP